MNAAHRRERLKDLLAKRFAGDRQTFLARAGLTKGRLSQLLDPAEPFGERAARSLEKRLALPKMYFDAGQDSVSGQPDDGRLMVPITLREEKLLAYFKALTPELQDEVIDAARQRAYAKQVTEKAKGAPVKKHVGNAEIQAVYGIPVAGDKEHPK